MTHECMQAPQDAKQDETNASGGMHEPFVDTRETTPATHTGASI
jgi:hypothetical protein